MKNKAFNRKQLIKDNIELETRLEQCYAYNTMFKIEQEQTLKKIQNVNDRIVKFNVLAEENERLRIKHDRIKKVMQNIMKQFNITYDHDKKAYKQIINRNH